MVAAQQMYVEHEGLAVTQLLPSGIASENAIVFYRSVETNPKRRQSVKSQPLSAVTVSLSVDDVIII